MKKDDIEETLAACLEMVDDKLPLIGPIMDLPIVNDIEHEVIKIVVDLVWDLEVTAPDFATCFCSA